MVLTLLILSIIFKFASTANPVELFGWNEVEFKWLDSSMKLNALKSGYYIPENNLPLGIDRWRNKLFITVPRWKNGVASTLNYIEIQPLNRSAELIPYPNWNANFLSKLPVNQFNENHIVSVFRTAVDHCDRLWAMETGVADILGDTKVLSKPAILVFDLNTDRLLRRYEFKTTDVKEDSFFPNIVVETTSKNCEDAFAYVPDMFGYGLIVYSWAENDSWRVKHNYFSFDPLQGDITVGGKTFQWNDGLFGLALSRTNRDGFRTLYFHPMASINEFSVNTRVLRNKTVATDPNSYGLFRIEGRKGEKSQTSVSALDEKTGVLFLALIQRDAVVCWNTHRPLNVRNLGLVAQDRKKLIFINDLAIDDERNLYILSNRMSNFMYDGLDVNDINFRILRVEIDKAIRETPCSN